MLFHPSRRDLIAHAEALVSGRSMLSPMARHIARCERCSLEVRSIRRTLEFMDSAPGLGTSQRLTDAILRAARNEARTRDKARRRIRSVKAVFKTAAFAASLLAAAVVCFQTALTDPGAATPVAVRAEMPSAKLSEGPSPEEIRKATVEISSFGEAVGSRISEPRSIEEWRHARAVSALNADLSAARAALEAYPGCERASRLMNANLQRKAQVLRALYVEQGS